MHMRTLIGAAAIVANLAMASTAWAQAKQDFTVVNKTGYNLSKMYVSPSKSEDWDEDILGRDVMADGEEFDITFDRGDKACKWDLKVIYEDDNSSAVWHDINLCEVSRITIMYNRKTDTTSARFD